MSFRCSIDFCRFVRLLYVVFNLKMKSAQEKEKWKMNFLIYLKRMNVFWFWFKSHLKTSVAQPQLNIFESMSCDQQLHNNRLKWSFALTDKWFCDSLTLIETVTDADKDDSIWMNEFLVFCVGSKRVFCFSVHLRIVSSVSSIDHYRFARR